MTPKTNKIVQFSKGWRINSDAGNIIIQHRYRGEWVDEGYYMSFQYAVQKLVDTQLKVTGLGKAKDILKRLESIERTIRKGLT